MFPNHPISTCRSVDPEENIDPILTCAGRYCWLPCEWNRSPFPISAYEAPSGFPFGTAHRFASYPYE